ncbi:MAG TPA: NADH-ubiquinone oxidoreductase-F iron-sulfur binding region domain-containing protein [Caldilineaceae bacterium]|nr:NADH-ubiquinone oxidoreductase-F iron-sulfur binding region domain-containing protein [Caldilineaceae bacterium]
MSASTDQALIERWRYEPAPLLPLLHAFHQRDGYLTDQALRAIAGALRIPLADLYGTVTFYHHLARSPAAARGPRVCTGPICCLHGAEQALARLADQGAQPMPCAGRCDAPVPVLHQGRVWTVDESAQLRALPSPLPPPNPAGKSECVFAHLREPDRATLAGYQRTGGYEGLARALRHMTPNQVIEHIRAARLAGRGGAGFPTGLKWQAVREATGAPKYVVCNADEGEPGCFKDRAILDYDPHAVIEGMLIAGYATGATRGFLYLRYEYPETYARLEHALAEARAAGILGGAVLGSDFSFEIYLRRGAGAYICGEETSLLNSLEGKHPFPRNRPPYPVTHGFENRPTAVNNVETLAAVPPILRHEPAWYHSLGVGEQAGTKIISLSGDIQRPGNYEVPLGLPLAELLYEWAGGPQPGRAIQAVTMAGLSGGFLAGDDLNVTLDEPSLRAKNSFLGAGGIMVFDDSRDMMAVAAQAITFFAHESCGKCFPCRIGAQRLMERLAGEGPAQLDEWLAEVEDLGRTMRGLSACGLGQAAPNVTDSLVRYFPDQVRRAVTNASPRARQEGAAAWAP